MITRPSLSSLIESAIGALGLESIAHHEHHTVSDRNNEIRSRLQLLQSAINGASSASRSSRAFIENLISILKSTEITCAPEFIAFLGRKYPRILIEISEDPLINHRIQHLYLVMELNDCFSGDAMKKLNLGIEGVRRKVFNLSQRMSDIESHADMFNDNNDNAASSLVSEFPEAENEEEL